MSTLVCFYEEGCIQYASIVSEDTHTAAAKLKELLERTGDDKAELEDDGGLNLPPGATNVVLRNDDPNYDKTTIYAVLPFSEANVARVLAIRNDYDVVPLIKNEVGLTPV